MKDLKITTSTIYQLDFTMTYIQNTPDDQKHIFEVIVIEKR